MANAKRYHIIIVLLLINSLAISQILIISTTPIHEFGHYLIAKQFGWDIVEVDWFSHVEMTEETIDNAPLIERVLVSSAGMILTLIIPYIIFIFIKKRSATINLIFSSYLILEFGASCGDIKNLCSATLKALFWPSITMVDFTIGSPINLISSTSAVIIVVYVTMVALNKYGGYLVDVATLIENLPEDEEQENIQDEE